MKHRPSLVRGLIYATAVALAVVAYALFQTAFTGQPLGAVFMTIASFGCFGLVLGATFFFDAPTAIGGTNRPFVRVALSASAGVRLALLWRWPAEGAALSVAVAATLGYFGITWAEYVDF